MNIMLKTFIILSILLLLVNAEPSCEYKDDWQEWMVCYPGDKNYILRRGLVSDNNITYSIRLDECRIIDIDVGAFEKLPAVQRLNLAENAFTTLKLGIFDPVTNLAFLNLSYNSLVELPAGLFDRNTELKALDLNGNRLRTIEFGLFQPLAALVYLYISSNYISGKDLHPNTFEKNTKINYLDFSKNYLYGAPKKLFASMHACDFLILHENFLTEVPSFALTDNFKTLRSLNLSTNQIMRIDGNTFRSLDELGSLYLTDNKIEYINENAFKHLKYLYVLDLSVNRLETISDTQFQNLPLLREIDLSENILKKVPASAFKRTALSGLYLSNNKITYLEENFCMKLNSSSEFEAITFENNPWQCACFRELFLEVKAMEIAYEDEYFDGAHRVCVTTGDFACKRQENLNNFYIDMYNSL